MRGLIDDAALRRRVDEVKARISLGTLIGRGVKLIKRGREFVGSCPFHNESTPSFTVAEDKGFAHCFGCGWHGDAIRYAMDHDGLNFMEALAALEADAGLQAETAQLRRDSAKVPERSTNLIDPRRAAAWVWRHAGPARGELPEAWLRARGIDPDATGLLDVVRFLADCPGQLWNPIDGPARVRRRAEAMIAPILRITGGRGAREFSMIGVHITYLAPDGRSKAQFPQWQDRRSGKWMTPPNRVMWGAISGGAVPIPRARILPGCELKEALARQIDLVASGPLLMGEGIESSCSLLTRHPECRIGFAALSLGNLQGTATRKGPNDSLQWWQLAGEPGGAGFTIADPGAVLVGVDSDMKPTMPQWVQERPRERAVKRPLGAIERAELCGQVAAWHWRQAGASKVRIVRPPAGYDFNDLDRAETAA